MDEPTTATAESPASESTNEEYLDVIRISPAIHFGSCVQIENKARDLIRPIPNVLQIRMSQAYEACQFLDIPCFMLVLKPRQSGGSTFSAETVMLHMRNYQARAVCMADDYGNSKNLFRIFQRHVETDEFPWRSNARASNDEMRFGNGSWIEMDTAMNPKAGISASRNVIWMSEVAKYPSDGVRDAKKTIANMLASLNKTNSNSLAIAETTPEGASGWFYEHWQAGVSLDDFIAGRRGNGWIKVFAAWHEFDEHRIPVSEGEARDILATLNKREERGIKLYQWQVEQIAWRRVTLATGCGGDDAVFDEHYPEDPDSCFNVSGRPRFDIDGLLALQQTAKSAPAPLHGILSRSETGTSFRSTSENESLVQVFSEPRDGLRYLLAVDTARGASHTKGADPDCHSALVLQAGYSDGEKAHPIRIAARIRPPCRLDTDVLADIVTDLSTYYGKCLVVVERNAGESLIDILVRQGIPLYQETAVDMLTSKTRNFFGFQTDAESKRRVIDRLAALIRQSTIIDPQIIIDSHTAEELRHFIVDKKGHCAAKNGKHDDDVMALAIGITCIEAASAFRKVIRRRVIPRWRLS